MSCYHPIAAFPDYGERASNGKYKYKLAGAYDPGFKSLDPNVIKIPCGKCLGCRLDYSRSWADRMTFELDSCNGSGMFITLTYNNEHVPLVFGENDDFVGMTLFKRDFQLFMKRLRKRFPDVSIRFYAVGEYGGRSRRPHYHAILFGLDLEHPAFSDKRIVGKNELGQFYYTSSVFEDLWSDHNGSIGFVCLSPVSYKTCAYVARYCMKKAYGMDVPEGLCPEFTLMSRRPGIGAHYFEEHPDCVQKSKFYFSDSNGSVEVSLPKYFLKKFSLSNPSEYDKLVLDRAKLASDKEFLKLSRTSLSYLDYLELEENSKFNQTEVLNSRREMI